MKFGVSGVLRAPRNSGKSDRGNKLESILTPFNSGVPGKSATSIIYAAVAPKRQLTSYEIDYKGTTIVSGRKMPSQVGSLSDTHYL